MNVVLPFPSHERSGWTLADQAAAINKWFDRLDKSEARISKAKETANAAEWRSSHLRLNAGQSLLEAKKLLQEHQPGASFEAWCGTNVHRSLRDCYRCMWIAGSEEPERALWKERAEGAEDKAQNRSADRQDNPVCQQNRSVQIAIGLYRKMTAEQREQVKQAQEEIDNA